MSPPEADLSSQQEAGVVPDRRRVHRPERSLLRALAKWQEGPRGLRWAGWMLLLACATWWGANLMQKPLPHGVPAQSDYLKDRLTYIPLMPFLGLDFHHNYVAARSWQAGQDPYAALLGDPGNARYTYPPLTLVAFSWTRAFPPGPAWILGSSTGQQTSFAPSLPALFCWLAAASAIIGLASWQSWAAREQFGLGPLPFPFVLGAMLVSYPVCFELERGNCNTLPLLALVGVVRALAWRNPLRGDLAAGLGVAAAAGIKPFAVVLLLGLVAMRRFRAAGFAAGALLLEAIVLWPDLRRWLAVAHVQNQIQAEVYLDYSHSLISHWHLMWGDLGLPKLAALPAEPIVAALLLAAIVRVAWPVFRAEQPAKVAWPFFLWLAAMGTMISPVAQDYNLLFIPLAVLSAWSAADAWRLQLGAGVVLLWWQPCFVGLANLPWLLLKVASVAWIGLLIVRRAQAAAGASPR